MCLCVCRHGGKVIKLVLGALHLLNSKASLGDNNLNWQLWLEISGLLSNGLNMYWISYQHIRYAERSTD